MGIYNIYLIDMIPNSGRRLYRFSEPAKARVSDALTALFQQVCATTTRDPRASFGPGRPHPTELVVYFLTDRAHSIIGRQGGAVPTGHEGLIWWSSAGMISEVYVGPLRDAGSDNVMIAKTAFHECMHNKLDIHPQLGVVGDIHDPGPNGGGLGLASRVLNPGLSLTPTNIQLMQNALSLDIAQFWDPQLIFRARP